MSKPQNVLAGLGERTLDQLMAAIESGDSEQALALATRMHNEFLGMHDLFLNWTAALLSFIGKNYGDEVLEKASEETVQYYNNAVWDETLALAFANMSDKERIEALAGALRGHMHPFEVQEKEDCYEVVLGLCGSGARLIEKGVYEGDDALYKVKTPSPMTFGKKDFPVYCTHCHFQNKFIPPGMDEPLAEIIASDNVGHEPCVVRLYKRKN